MKRGRILIIDDDRQVSMALSIRLQAADYEVDVAHSGEAGLRRASEGAPQVILLDLRMPGIDGLEVIRRLRDEAGTASIPVIFVSANAQETTKRAALNAGGRFFLQKPFDSQVLLRTIERVLSEQPPQIAPV